jgi:hypothetical protein
MLVYANRLTFHGSGAEAAVFKAIGGWLKKQIGFGLHSDQLSQEGEIAGYRGDMQSWLRIYATSEEEPQLYAWVLNRADETARGRQWVTEVGVKIHRGIIEMSCIVRTDEHSTLVEGPAIASQPRVVRYAAADGSSCRSYSLLTLKVFSMRRSGTSHMMATNT